MSQNKIEMDCTRKCKSREHGAVITSSITKRSVSDVALASFIWSTCSNFIQAFDHEGRTALHMAASRGRKALLEWLAKSSSEAFLNARDRESGFTALHRSIFYGQIHIAVALSKIGVNFDIVDKDDYKAIDHAMLDRPATYTYHASQPCDVYVWGSNTNYTLGTGTQQLKKLPDVLTCFSRTNTSVKQACLGKFHAAWLDSAGMVWACGQGTRFGAAGSGTVLRPTQLRLSEPCLQLALTADSTVLLMQSGAILQFNISEVDTNSPQTQSSKPGATTIRLAGCKALLRLPNARGVVASRHHVAAWEGATVYTWGTNVGQLGHSAGERFVAAPRKVVGTLSSKEETQIGLVATCDAATLVTTSRGDVYLLHQHLCKKIITKQINLEHACVEGKVSELGVCSRITVVLMTNVGNLMLWQDDTNQLTRCVYGLNHPMVATHVALIHNSILFTTRHGEGFFGAISRRKPSPSITSPKVKERADSKKSSSFQRFLDKDDCTQIKLRKVPNVHRAVKIAADVEGLNFAVLQAQPNFGVTSVPELSASEFQEHMEDLLADASEDDLLHDLVFKIGPKLFPAHAYIIASSSEHLYKLYQEQLLLTEPATAKPTIALDHIHPAVFERILAYMYTGTCDVVHLGPCGLKVRKEELTGGQGQKDKVNEGGDRVEDFNPNEISAFEVHKQQKEKKSGKSRKAKNDPPVIRVNSHCDPVKLLQSSAKKLQVMTLHKLLDKFYYRDGRVYLKESALLATPKPGWERTSCPELHDTSVQSRDGALIPAHKCVLAARLEYFNGMFMHSWTENISKSQIQLPINEAILQPVIDFLYTDECPSVTSSDSIDFLTSLLIVSDQLFVNRLREMCEVALANLITLKNCTEMCQFAHTYNAEQLKKCCMQFISLNLCTFIENRNLEVLNDSLLEELTDYYTKFIPIMSSRIITPFSNAPDDETVNAAEKENRINLDNIDEDMKREEPIEVPRKKNKSTKKIEYTENEKARMRYESVSSVNALDLSTETGSGDITLSLRNLQLEGREQSPIEKKEQWIKAPSNSEKQQKIVQARLKAIIAAKILTEEKHVESFTKLTKHASSPPPQSVLFESSSPKAINSVLPQEGYFDSPRSPQGSIYISHVGAKLSQKQRKKLALESKSGWDDVLEKPVANEPSTSAPKNPWKVVEPPAQIVTLRKRTDPDFNEILADQRKQKDNFSKMMTKSLVMTQLEDKAIEELAKFYNIEGAYDEYISIRRIDIDMVASPQWIHTNSHPK